MSMFQKILDKPVSTASVFGKKEMEGDFGIELEVEALRAVPLAVPREWVAKEDGSLRNVSKEYVTVGIQSRTPEFFHSLSILCSDINHKDNGLILDSPRTSVHVHVNVTKFPIAVTWTGIIAWWLYEDYLINLLCCPRRRQGNHFCLPLSSAPGMLESLIKHIQTKNINHLADENLKYGAQNIWSLTKFGSVEYRCLEGRYDPLYIYQYSSMLVSLYERVQELYKNPAEFSKDVQKRGLVRVFASLFKLPDNLREKTSIRKLEDMCEGSLSFIHAACNCTTNWGWNNKNTPKKGKWDLDFIDDAPAPMPVGDPVAQVQGEQEAFDWDQIMRNLRNNPPRR